MKNIKNNVKGITLVALIVTIIILLILAGVTIQMITGDSGLFSKAQYASTLHEIENIREAINLYYAGEEIGGFLSYEKTDPVDGNVKKGEIKDDATELVVAEKQLVDLTENIRYEDLYYLSGKKLGISLPDKKYFMDKETRDVFINGGIKLGKENLYLLDEVNTITSNVLVAGKKVYAAGNNSYVLKEDKTIYSIRRIKCL